MSAWQPNNSLGFPPPLVEHFCVVTWTLIKIWHNSSPARNSHNKSSHQGKLSSLRDVPWPRCYLHVFIYITVAHRGWAETKVPWHFTLCTHTKTLFLPQRAAAHNSHFTPRWGDLPRAPQSAARPKICQQGRQSSVFQAAAPSIASPHWLLAVSKADSQPLFRQQLEVWSDLPPMCYCPRQRNSPALVILPKLSLQERFSIIKPQYKLR